MPIRALWEPDFSVGHELIDAQHQALLAQCQLLADHCTAADAQASERQFDEVFEHLKLLASEHFRTEVALLAECGYPGLEDHGLDCDEFQYLADEIATAENFDRLELQRFLTLWFVGHITGSAAQQRACLAGLGGVEVPPAGQPSA